MYGMSMMQVGPQERLSYAEHQARHPKRARSRAMDKTLKYSHHHAFDSPQPKGTIIHHSHSTSPLRIKMHNRSLLFSNGHPCSSPAAHEASPLASSLHPSMTPCSSIHSPVCIFCAPFHPCCQMSRRFLVGGFPACMPHPFPSLDPLPPPPISLYVACRNVSSPKPMLPCMAGPKGKAKVCFPDGGTKIAYLMVCIGHNHVSLQQ